MTMVLKDKVYSWMEVRVDGEVKWAGEARLELSATHVPGFSRVAEVCFLFDQGEVEMRYPKVSPGQALRVLVLPGTGQGPIKFENSLIANLADLRAKGDSLLFVVQAQHGPKVYGVPSSLQFDPLTRGQAQGAAASLTGTSITCCLGGSL